MLKSVICLLLLLLPLLLPPGLETFLPHPRGPPAAVPGQRVCPTLSLVCCCCCCCRCRCCCCQGLVRSCPTQEDPLPLFLASVYAQNHALMRLNSNSSTGFVNGTVQGSRWYTLLGGMQVRYFVCLSSNPHKTQASAALQCAVPACSFVYNPLALLGHREF
jgi:hypothetical protein